MKRWLAGLLALAFLFTGTAGLANEVPDEDRYKIEELLVSREEEDRGITNDLKLIRELLNNEDIRDLLQFEDIRTIVTEIGVKAGIWLIKHRPTTMEVLKELGVSDQEQECIGKIWDSGDRIHEAMDVYRATEEGAELQREYEALIADGVLQRAVQDFISMMKNKDIESVLDIIIQKAAEDAAKKQKTVQENGQLTKEAFKREMNTSSFMGSVILELLNYIEQSNWAQNSLPELIDNEHLWNVLRQLSGFNNQLGGAITEEVHLLTQDPEVMDFLDRTIKAISDLAREYKEKLSSADTEAAEDETDNDKATERPDSETISEEVTP